MGISSIRTSLLPTEYIIRPVRPSDLVDLARLEQEVWTPLAAPVLSLSNLSEWYEDHSPFFLVAEDAGTLCGYYFGRCITYCQATVSEFLCPTYTAGKGYTTHPHEPEGNCLYGISIASQKPGAGHALYVRVQEIYRERGLRYSIGISRLPGLDLYLRTYEHTESTVSGPPSLSMMALWYSLESARLCTGISSLELTMLQELHLPKLSTPDPVLAFHLRNLPYRIRGIIPDPQSRGFGALLVSETFSL
jgi:hypothetical protein